VETDEILLIEKDSSQSLIFQVYRNEESDLTENLILSRRSDGRYAALMAQYKLTQ